MTKAQLIITIGMPIVVMLNAWLVAAASSRWKKQPPKKNAVMKLLAFIIDMALLFAFPCTALLVWDRALPASSALVVLMVLSGSLFTLQVLVVFHRWIKPRIVT